jgi:hypothetical protein
LHFFSLWCGVWCVVCGVWCVTVCGVFGTWLCRKFIKKIIAKQRGRYSFKPHSTPGKVGAYIDKYFEASVCVVLSPPPVTVHKQRSL